MRRSRLPSRQSQGRGDDRPAVVTAVEDRNWLSVALAEYSAVRAEIIQALQAQHTIVSYGASVIAVVTAVAIGTADDGTSAAQHLVTFLFLVLIPVLTVVIYMVWGSEVLRMQRAGTYLFVLEKVLNARVLGADPLNWEHVVNPPPREEEQVGRLRVMTDQRCMPNVDRLQRMAVPIALLAMVIGSVAAGLLMGDLDWMIVLTTVSVAAGFVGFLWLESERLLLRILYAHVCKVEQDDNAGQPLSMQVWVSSFTRWPTPGERVSILRGRMAWPA